MQQLILDARASGRYPLLSEFESKQVAGGVWPSRRAHAYRRQAKTKRWQCAAEFGYP